MLRWFSCRREYHNGRKKEARGQRPVTQKRKEAKKEARGQRPEASNTNTEGRQGFAGLCPLASVLWPVTQRKRPGVRGQRPVTQTRRAARGLLASVLWPLSSALCVTVYARLTCHRCCPAVLVPKDAIS